ncbi:hypothetical protein ACFVAV_33490 [Nocardia sp. NPDC057663]|uniref:hypothetical protein n=1 Tax=Nocardia sp. NPDC057663 TaxID=3346201 RepID=UPI0036717719
MFAEITHATVLAASVTAGLTAITRITITLYALKGAPPKERPAIIRALDPLLRWRRPLSSRNDRLTIEP